MDTKTLKALKGSIKKWENIVLGKGQNLGADNCPLCKVFLTRNRPCVGCPVRTKTGKVGCGGTPYEDFIRHPTIGYQLLTTTNIDDYPGALRHARRMYDFLVDLLPKKKGR